MKVSYTCKFCGKVFEDLRCNPRNYCCWEHSNKKPRTQQVCLNCSSIFYKVHVSDKRSYCCKKCRSEGMSKRYMGSNAPGWRGGMTPERRKIRNTLVYRNTQKIVFEMDNYTCALCDKRGGNLQMHHIQTFWSRPDLILELYNLITLCGECHNQTKGCEDAFVNILSEVRDTRLYELL